jgi:hypothetical protein
MIRYMDHHEIDMEKWDACIDSAPNGIFYAYSWYLDMLAPPWGGLVEGDYRSVMPLPYRKKFGVHYIYQPAFIQQLGIFSTHSMGEELTRKFIAAIPGHFRYADIPMNTFNKVPPLEGVLRKTRVTYELDLIPTYEEIYKRYSENARRNLKKAEKRGVFIAAHGRPEEVITAFRSSRKRDPYTEKDYQALKHLIYSGMHRGNVSLYSAYSDKNNFSAGIVFYHTHKKVVFLFSGSAPEARENGAMFKLVDAFIRDHAGRELVLDFEGSSDPSLARFYRGFGSKECLFLQLRINRMPGMLKPVSRAYLWLREQMAGKG